MIYKYISICFFALMLVSCSGETKTEVIGQATLDYLNSTDQFSEINKEEFGVLIIPGTGCGSCISRTLANVDNNIKLLDNIKLIYTNYVSLKGYRLRYGDDIFTHNNFIADRESKFYNFSKDVSTPLMLYYEDGKAVQMDLISLKNVDEVFSAFNGKYGSVNTN